LSAAKWEAEKEWAEAAIAWKELLQQWNRGRLESNVMRNFPEADLGKQTPGDLPLTNTMLNGIVQHTIWHGGPDCDGAQHGEGEMKKEGMATESLRAQRRKGKTHV